MSSDVNFTQTVSLPDGSSFLMTAYYVPMQYGWFFQSLIYGNFLIHGLRICNLPNILYQFRNQLPFGIACYTQGNREPTQQQDFSSGSSSLYLLSAAEVAAYTGYLSGTVSL